ncbi:MAG: sodium-dependent transporter [Spirochaetales bacterium]|nr:sodium-dependent transporter [Spirochaetales bacterium]
MADRESWSGKFGFVAATVGAAIGLGNLWMFPWRLGKYGGAVFLIPYLLFIFGLAVIGLTGEFGFGRSKQKGPIGAFKKVFEEKELKGGGLLGAIPWIGTVGVFIFYLIVTGWVIRYFVLSFEGFQHIGNIPAVFGSFVGHPSAVIWHAVAAVITMGIVLFGIQKGIEKANKYMIPLLFIFLAVLLVRSLTLPNAGKGLAFLFVPKWSELLKGDTWIMALGQAFFTVSLGGAGMVVYGSYLKKDVNIPSAALNTAIYDTVASFLAALVIMPAVFSFGLDPAAGPPLLFITLPSIFNEMPAGQIFSIIFFLAVIFAALSTSIALMEVAVEAAMDRLKWGRKISVVVVGVLAFLIGLPLTLNMEWFGKFANFVTIYLVPIGALLAAFTFFWVYGIDRAWKEVKTGAKKPIGAWWKFYAKYIFVIATLVVVVLGIIYKGIG